MANERPALPWGAAAAGLLILQTGVFLGSPSGGGTVGGLFDGGESAESRTVMTMAEAYGDQYAEYAVICPADSPEMVTRSLGGEARRIPSEGIPPSRNYLMLRTLDGQTEWHLLRREVVDFCGDEGHGWGLRPIDDRAVLRFDEETGRWLFERSA